MARAQARSRPRSTHLPHAAACCGAGGEPQVEAIALDALLHALADDWRRVVAEGGLDVSLECRQGVQERGGGRRYVPHDRREPPRQQPRVAPGPGRRAHHDSPRRRARARRGPGLRRRSADRSGHARLALRAAPDDQGERSLARPSTSPGHLARASARGRRDALRGGRRQGRSWPRASAEVDAP